MPVFLLEPNPLPYLEASVPNQGVLVLDRQHAPHLQTQPCEHGWKLCTVVRSHNAKQLQKYRGLMIQQEILVYERKLLKRKCIGLQYPRCKSSYRFDHVHFETPG